MGQQESLDVDVKNDESSPVPVNVINDESSPVPVNAQTIVEWRYVGLTAFEDDGRFEFGGLIGIAAMNKACADETYGFGPGARAASIAEALQRDDLSSEIRVGWVAPAGPMVTEPFGADFYPVDASTGRHTGRAAATPFFAISGAYCARYQLSDTSFRGVATSGVDAHILVASCATTRPVACSAPVAIPVVP